MQFVRSDNCKRPLYITRITQNSMILRKKYLFEKIQVFAFHKIIGIMSEAWYTMDILANKILGHGSVTIATKMLIFLFTDNSQKTF